MARGNRLSEGRKQDVTYVTCRSFKKQFFGAMQMLENAQCFTKKKSHNLPVDGEGKGNACLLLPCSDMYIIHSL